MTRIGDEIVTCAPSAHGATNNWEGESWNGGWSQEKHCVTKLWQNRPAGRQIRDGDGQVLAEQHAELPDHAAALKMVLTWLHNQKQSFNAVGYRLVHGGQHYTKNQRITPTMEKALARLKRLDPDHLPHEAIKTVRRAYPNLKQVACFDTAFHRSMPQVAQMFPFTLNLWRAGVRRFPGSARTRVTCSPRRRTNFMRPSAIALSCYQARKAPRGADHGVGRSGHLDLQGGNRRAHAGDPQAGLRGNGVSRHSSGSLS